MNTQRVLNNPNIKGITDAVQNISLYDVKAYYRKAQNVMMNFSPMEAKVREATNNEPWGASSTLMQEIADGTFIYASFNEIMPMIYRRFTEKTASEWRQIYKALQLLEYLIKHGSERVIDDARSHISAMTILRSFHYIDANGKDQGINVRNRSKELVALLGDDERIRSERKKARAAKDKFSGSASHDGGGFGGTGKKYGGFGNEAEYGGYNGEVYGDGGGFGGRASSSAAAASTSAGNHYSRSSFEEYDAGGDYEGDTTNSYAAAASSPPASSAPVMTSSKGKAKAVEAVPDLLSFGEEDAESSGFGDFAQFQPPPSLTTTTAATPSGTTEDNSFGDFAQFQPPPVTSATPIAPSTPSLATLLAGQNQQYQQPSLQQPSLQQPAFQQPVYQQTTYQQQTYQQPTYPQQPVGGFPGTTASPVMTPNYNINSGVSTAGTPGSTGYRTGPNYTGIVSPNSPVAQKQQDNKKKDDVFGALWSTAASGVSKKTSAPGTPSTVGSGVSMSQLAQQSATAGIWNQATTSTTATTTAPTSAQQNSSSSGNDLLLL
ncbi:uncharacterized protein V1516DRAFT_675988 [Lipomyces oligophaga]|uniref:uncharacterized protein n=1 Tax=Lipomyces oligophaga TaxID=45792 RepID=UPI0034CF4B75